MDIFGGRGDCEKNWQSADTFVGLYYRIHDDRRVTLSKFYKNDCCILWNGNLFTGYENFSTAILNTYLPKTSHRIKSYDVQKIPGDDLVRIIFLLSSYLWLAQ
jgi:hypothetical protein